MKENTAKFFRGFVSAVCAIITAVGGVLLGYFLLPVSPVWGWIVGADIAVLVLILILNSVSAKRYKKQYEDMSARQSYDYSVKLQREIEKDYSAAERTARRSIRMAQGMLVLVLLLTFGCCLFFGATRVDWVALPGTFFTFVLCSLFGRMFYFSAYGTAKNRLRREEFPLLYAVVCRAAKAVGYTDRIRMELSGSIGVGETGRCVNIGLKAAEVALLTQKELYTVMLHEFAHVVNVDTARSRYFAWVKDTLLDDGGVLFGYIADLLIGYFTMRVALHIGFYEMIATRHHEALADEKVRESGSVQDYVNATAKTALFMLYDEHPFRETRYDCYAGETPPENLASFDLECFRSALETFGERWRKVLAVELPARIASHPTFRQRMETMGCESFNTETVESDEAYIDEQKKLLAFADRRNYEELAPHYAQVREQVFLSRKEQMEKYEKSVQEGKKLPLDELVHSLQAFYIVDNEKALAVADRMLADDPDSAYAHLYRGNIFFDELDERCVEEFRTAMRVNHQFCDYCLDHIGQFALLSGDEKLLQEYRSGAPEVAQEAYDREKEMVWTKKIPLRPCALPAETLEEIADRLRAMGEDWVALRAYAADFGSEKSTCTMISVEFPKNCIGTLLAENMDSLYEYLDSRSESFRLHLYGKDEKRAFLIAGIHPFWERNPSQSEQAKD